MADFIGRLPPNATEGERAVHARLIKFYEASPEVFVYYEPGLGDFRPDFLVLDPNRGVIIVEVKDYHASGLVEVTASGAWFANYQGEGTPRENPFDQIHQYFRAVMNKLKFCPALRDRVPPVTVTQLVALPNIPRESGIGQGVLRVQPRRVGALFQEDSSSNRQFADQWRSLVPGAVDLTSDEFDLVRGNLVPTSRLPTPTQTTLDAIIPSSITLKLMDARQEKLATNLGEGHRLFFGVAGSGKTVLLIARARQLALAHDQWSILVLCYNRNLSRYLQQLINPQDFEADIEVNTFHGWARRFIMDAGPGFAQAYEEAERNSKREGDLDFFFNQFVPTLLGEVIDSGNVPLYDAILIDEAQDWVKDWFPPVLGLLNPKTNSLLVTLDGIQGLYARKKFTWKEVGIQASGRVKKFRKSYRNPAEIGRLAFDLLPKELSTRLGQEDEFVTPEEFARHGGKVHFDLVPNRTVEYKTLVDHVRDLKNAKQAVIVVFRKNPAKLLRENHPFFTLLKEANISWTPMHDWTLRPSGIVLVGTPQGTKGLEADVVCIPELDTYRASDPEARQLVFVAMTRALHQLYLSAAHMTPFVGEIREKLTPSP